VVLLSIGGFSKSSGIEIGLILAEAIQRRGEFAEQLGRVVLPLMSDARALVPP
jgi:hypothetical protein